MSLTLAVVLGCLACFALKLAGYFTPAAWLAGERTSRVTTALPVALLAALVGVQTFTGDAGRVVLDARLVALLVALVLLRLRANFVVVVVAAAGVAALLRATGTLG
jgi:branched-subunit amino acid transport protein